ncbi:hypothetical protein FOCC_FOCC017639 [Frankliniella occidentalis]|nr:hypothetical protein FOCC_FOCC017639 [Frankliniella occidentalis]
MAPASATATAPDPTRTPPSLSTPTCPTRLTTPTRDTRARASAAPTSPWTTAPTSSPWTRPVRTRCRCTTWRWHPRTRPRTATATRDTATPGTVTRPAACRSTPSTSCTSCRTRTSTRNNETRTARRCLGRAVAKWGIAGGLEVVIGEVPADHVPAWEAAWRTEGLSWSPPPWSFPPPFSHARLCSVTQTFNLQFLVERGRPDSTSREGFLREYHPSRADISLTFL